MKTTSIKNRIATSLLVSLPCLGLASGSPPDLVAHEWGTFTSVQGGDGVLIKWQPFVKQDLPDFVYDWSRPGLGREMPINMALTKGSMIALQRMETPVIYFYSDRELTADVTVKFPDGFITEWYPQAQQVGSLNWKSFVAKTANPKVSNQPLNNSVISWPNLRIIPTGSSHGETPKLISDGTDNHYFAARETDSALVHTKTGGLIGSTPEVEKLLFYRGAGNFGSPLKVTLNNDGELAVENTGKSPLAHLFLVQVRNGEGMWSYLENVPQQSRQTWKSLGESKSDQFKAAKEFQKELGGKLEESLVVAGLYPREAAAMVKTWSKSWFAEDGVRVLYLLPGEWTEATLPITFNPQPKELVRVMVGRAEIIPPQLQLELAGDIAKAKDGDSDAEQRLKIAAKKLGRFYGPAHQLAMSRLKPTETAAVSRLK